MGIWRITVAGLALLGLVVVNGGAAAQTKPFKQARFPYGGGIVYNSGAASNWPMSQRDISAFSSSATPRSWCARRARSTSVPADCIFDKKGRPMRLLTVITTTLGILLGLSQPAVAQSIKGAPTPCGLSIVQNQLLHRAAFEAPKLKADKVRIIYLGHSTFQIETPGGTRAATDFNGFNLIPNRLPHIVTMNNSHDTHYTDHVDAAIKFVLRGWNPAGGIALHHMKHRDMRVYNLPTNIYGDAGGATNGNSVFVFEAAGICAAHLGHLHHALSKEQVKRIGRIDVLFLPIDGTVTLSHEEAFNIIDQIKPRIIMPMHFSFGGPFAFVEQARSRFPIRRHKKSYIDIGRADLPAKTEVLFLGFEF